MLIIHPSSFSVQNTSETVTKAPILLRHFTQTVADAFQRGKKNWCLFSNLDDHSFPVLHINNIFQSPLTTGPNLPLQNPCVSWAVLGVGETQGAHLSHVSLERDGGLPVLAVGVL